MAYGEKVAVDGLSLTVATGSITAVLGPNGAGKTTTLETCEGYRKPQGGRVRVLGLDPQARRHLWSLVRTLRDRGHTVVLTTHYMEEAENLADHVHVIDRGRLIASGSPFELTRGTGSSTIRLVVTEPFPPAAPASLQRTLGPGTDVVAVNRHSLLITGPADARTLAKVSAWCEENGVLPESMSLGQRTLEDVFLQITGRELAV